MTKKDPKNPTDMLGRPIKEGDIVAWGTKAGNTPAVAVARISKIRFTRESPQYKATYTGPRSQEVPQHLAEEYKLYLEVLKTTGYQSYVGPNGDTSWSSKPGYRSKPRLVSLVENIVRLDITEEELDDLLCA